MKAEKINHRGIDRIKVDFPFNNEIANRLKTISDCKWSRTHKAWHIPYHQDALLLLKKLFPEVEYAFPEALAAIDTPEDATKPVIVKTSISIFVLGRKIVLKLPKNQNDIDFLLSFRFSRWDAQNKCWNIPSTSKG